MLGFQYRQTRDYDNFQIGHFRGEGRYEIPILQAGEMPPPGNVISGYPEDGNDHAIDAVRYAMERVWKRRGE